MGLSEAPKMPLFLLGAPRIHFFILKKPEKICLQGLGFELV